jgi:hypothetical protein
MAEKRVGERLSWIAFLGTCYPNNLSQCLSDALAHRSRVCREARAILSRHENAEISVAILVRPDSVLFFPLTRVYHWYGVYE